MEQVNQAALEQLMPLVDEELHRLAHQHMRREKPGHVLQTFITIHEIDQVNNVVEDNASQSITVVLNWTAKLKK